MNIKKIIWATDGSGEADVALGYAKYIAGLTGAEIIGVHVIPLPTVMLFESLSGDDIEFTQWMKKVENNFSDKFVKLGKEFSKSNIDFDGVLLKGNPSEKIRELARRRGGELIVMGKHGHGILGSIILGSETAKVVKNSDMPVLITKGKKGQNKIGFKNILVPIDLSEKCETALLYAMDLAEKCAGRITAIYALSLDMYAQDIPAGALDIIIKQSVSELNKTVERIKKKYKGSKEISIKKEVIHGLSPAFTINNYAEQKNSDLIVIHTHGRTGIKRLILGSVTEKIVNNASCTVLALRPG